MQKLILIFAFALAAPAQTTVTGTISVPTGDLVSGSCSIAAVGPFSGTNGFRVIGAPVVVKFTAGALSVELTPTDSATPSGQYYRVTCSVPLQSVGGHSVGPLTWGPKYWLVPTSGTALDIGSVEVSSAPPAAGLQVLWQQMAQNNAVTGQGPVWSGSSWIPRGGGYSMPLLLPSGNDDGLFQKSDDYTYSITAVACNTGQGTVTINLDVRTASAPNDPGTMVLPAPLVCTGTGTATAQVSPPVLVPAGAPVALRISAVSGTPDIVRVHVSR